MILSVERGRLGNQLFQYSALKSLAREGERLVLVGYRELEGLVELRNVIRLEIERDLFSRVCLRSAVGLLSLLARVKIFGSIENDAEVPGRHSVRRDGLLPVFVSLRSYFQEPQFVDDQRDDLCIKESLLRQADAVLANHLDQKVVLVHVRRGDYLTWPSRENPAVLPWWWFEKAMQHVAERINDPVFLFLSDDGQYIKDLTANRPNCVYLDLEEHVAIAVMSRTYWQIISASSFSWWGAEFARRSRGSVLTIAPKYCAGWGISAWLPNGISSPFISYLEVRHP